MPTGRTNLSPIDIKNTPHLVVFSKRLKPKRTTVFDTYWRFAAERQNVFFAQHSKRESPWTRDPIIQEYRFTNSYRASDRVSQYLIRNVIYSGTQNFRDTVFRILLFKIFNKIETWRLLEESMGEISLKSFDINSYSAILEKAMSSRAAIYSAAYIMPSGSIRGDSPRRKHRFHLELLEELMNGHFLDQLREKRTMAAVYEVLLGVKSFGVFLAYQFATDLNYSTHFDFSEREFVVPGPGARDGIRKCFSDLGDYNEPDVIRMMADEQTVEFDRLQIDFHSLWGRPLQLIDCQNLFCEVDKYARVAHPDIQGISNRTRIKRRYVPRSNVSSAWYPPKWGLNEMIPQ